MPQGQVFELTLKDGRKVDVTWNKPAPPTPDDVDALAKDAEEAFAAKPTLSSTSIVGDTRPPAYGTGRVPPPPPQSPKGGTKSNASVSVDSILGALGKPAPDLYAKRMEEQKRAAKPSEDAKVDAAIRDIVTPGSKGFKDPGMARRLAKAESAAWVKDLSWARGGKVPIERAVQGLLHKKGALDNIEASFGYIPKEGEGRDFSHLMDYYEAYLQNRLQDMPGNPRLTKALKQVQLRQGVLTGEINREAESRTFDYLLSPQGEQDVLRRRFSAAGPLERGTKLVLGGVGDFLSGTAGMAGALGVPGAQAAGEFLQADFLPNELGTGEQLLRMGGQILAMAATGGMSGVGKLGSATVMQSLKTSANMGVREGLIEGGHTYLDMRKQGNTHAEASQAAMQVFTIDTIAGTILNRFGEFAPGKSHIGRILMAMPSESLEEVQQQIAQNLAMGRPYDEGILEAAELGALGGAAFTGVLSAGEFSARLSEAVKHARTTKDMGLVKDVMRQASGLDGVVKAWKAGQQAIATAEVATKLKVRPSQAAQILKGLQEATNGSMRIEDIRGDLHQYVMMRDEAGQDVAPPVTGSTEQIDVQNATDLEGLVKGAKRRGKDPVKSIVEWDTIEALRGFDELQRTARYDKPVEVELPPPAVAPTVPDTRPIENPAIPQERAGAPDFELVPTTDEPDFYFPFTGSQAKNMKAEPYSVDFDPKLSHDQNDMRPLVGTTTWDKLRSFGTAWQESSDPDTRGLSRRGDGRIKVYEGYPHGQEAVRAWVIEDTTTGELIYAGRDIYDDMADGESIVPEHVAKIIDMLDDRAETRDYMADRGVRNPWGKSAPTKQIPGIRTGKVNPKGGAKVTAKTPAPPVAEHVNAHGVWVGPIETITREHKPSRYRLAIRVAEHDGKWGVSIDQRGRSWGGSNPIRLQSMTFPTREAAIGKAVDDLLRNHEPSATPDYPEGRAIVKLLRALAVEYPHIQAPSVSDTKKPTALHESLRQEERDATVNAAIDAAQPGLEEGNYDIAVVRRLLQGGGSEPTLRARKDGQKIDDKLFDYSPAGVEALVKAVIVHRGTPAPVADVTELQKPTSHEITPEQRPIWLPNANDPVVDPPGVTVFASGSNSPVLVEAAENSKRYSIGTAAPYLLGDAPKALATKRAIVLALGRGAKVFVDSGAFSGNVEWHKLFELYDELVRVAGVNAKHLTLVMPDVVGDQAATAQLWRKVGSHWNSKVKHYDKQGVGMIWPMQKGDLRLGFLWNIIPFQSDNMIAGIPANKFPVEPAEVAELLTGGQVKRIHLLGISDARAKRVQEYLDAIRGVDPDVPVTMDANRNRAMVGPGRVKTEDIKSGDADKRANDRVQGEEYDYARTELSDPLALELAAELAAVTGDTFNMRDVLSSRKGDGTEWDDAMEAGEIHLPHGGTLRGWLLAKDNEFAAWAKRQAELQATTDAYDGRRQPKDESGRPKKENDGNPVEREDSGTPAEVSTEDVGGTREDGSSGGVRPSGEDAGNRDAGDADGSGVPAPPSPGDGLPGGSSTERGGDASLGRNHRITDLDVIPHTPAGKRDALIAALEVLRTVEAKGRPATSAEQKILAAWPGWGWTGNELNPKKATAFYQQVRDLLDEPEMNAAWRATLNSHYTDPRVVDLMHKAMKRMGFDGQGTALELGAGTGFFLGIGPKDLRWTAIEMDSLTGRILKLLYPRADVHQAGMQEVSLPSGGYDVAMGNVPFDKNGVRDQDFLERTKNPALLAPLHNYAIAKAIDAVRPGGMVAVITSRYTLDATSPAAVEFRRWAAEHADLVAAYRLPSDAFEKTAGTSVTTDLLIFRKRFDHETPGGVPFQAVTSIAVANKFGEETYEGVNEYYVTHKPAHALGEHAAGHKGLYNANEYSLIRRRDSDTIEDLGKAMRGLPTDLYTARETDAPKAPKAVPVARRTRAGSYFKSEDGKIHTSQGRGTSTAFEGSEAEAKIIESFMGLRDQVNSTIALMQENASDAQLGDAQKLLRTTYDAFVKKHGPLHGKARKLIIDDPDSFGVLALERWDSETRKVTGLSDIFTKRVINVIEKVRASDSPQDAVRVSIHETGKVDLDRIAELVGSTDRDALIESLRGIVWRDHESGQYVTTAEFGSGNVRAKHDRAVAAGDTDAAKFLEGRIPRDVEAEDIRASIGATWIPPRHYEKFLLDTFGGRVPVKYVPATGAFEAKVSGWVSFRQGATATQEFGTQYMDGISIFEVLLNGRNPTVWEKDPDGRRFINKEETALAVMAGERLRAEFESWVFSDQARTRDLVRIYNDTLNNWAPREYSGEDVSLPGSNPLVTLDPHQKKGVVRIVQSRATLLDHEVGTGKTFTMIAAAMELRRTGIRRKPMIVVQNSTVVQFAESVRTLYPGARVLVASDDNFTGNKRREFMGLVATNDWDMVVVPHSSFTELAMSKSAVKSFYDRQIEDLRRYKQEQEREEGKDNFTVKQIEKALVSLENQLQKQMEKLEKRQDEALTFEQLGVDALMVDEAHAYKNLFTKSVEESLNVAESQRAMDMFMKTEYLHANDGHLVFATGTPLSNSIVEMHTLMRYLAPKDLRDSGLANFDAWWKTYAAKTTEMERDVAGRWRMKARLSRFSNVPELVQIYTQFADLAKASDVGRINIPRRVDMDGKAVVGPSLEEIQLSGDQIDFLQTLVVRANSLKNTRNAEKGDDNMLAISTDGRKASLDLRLVDPDAAFDPNGKVAKLVRNVVRIRKDSTAGKGTQLIFLDYGTPGNKTFDMYADIKMRLIESGIPADEIAFIHDAKNDAQRMKLFEKMREGKIRVLLASTEKGGVGVNVQARLKALHHVDPKWRPADMEQRSGRMFRQGNQYADEGVVEIQYVTVNSFDSFMWDGMKRKAGFIAQLREGALAGTREVEDIGGEETSNSYEDIAAFASGNPAVKEYMQLRNKVSDLQHAAGTHAKRTGIMRGEIPALEAAIENRKGRIQALRDSAPRFAKTYKVEDFQIAGDRFETAKELGHAILREIEQAAERQSSRLVDFGKLGDLKVSVRVEVRGSRLYAELMLIDFGNEWASTSVSMTEQLERLQKVPAKEAESTRDYTASSTVNRLLKSMEKFPESIEAAVKSQEGDTLKLTQAKAAVDKPFPEAARLEAGIKRLGELSVELGLTGEGGAAGEGGGGWGQGQNLRDLPGKETLTMYHGTQEAFDTPRAGSWWSTDRGHAESFSQKRNRPKEKQPRIIEREIKLDRVLDLSADEVATYYSIEQYADIFKMTPADLQARLTPDEWYVHESNARFGGVRLWIALKQGGLARLAEAEGYDAIKARERTNASKGTETADTYLVFTDQAEAEPMQEGRGPRGGPVPNPKVPRIKVDPLPGGNSKNVNAIAIDFGKALGHKFRVGKTPRKAGGVYKPWSGDTVIRFSGDIDTLAHEMAHFLDDRFGIVSKWALPRTRSPYDYELSDFWQYGSVAKTGPRSKLSYKRAEGVAEYLRAWVMNPAATEAQAPKFTAYIKANLPPEVWGALANLSRDVREWAGLAPGDRVKANIRLTPKAQDPIRRRLQVALKGEGYVFETTFADRWAALTHDTLAPVMKGIATAMEITGAAPLPEGDPVTLMRLHAGLNSKAAAIFEHGMIDHRGKRVTPGGVEWLLEPFDRSTKATMQADMDDTIAFMVAQRTLERGEPVRALEQQNNMLALMGQKPLPIPFAKSDRTTGIGLGMVDDLALARSAIQDLRTRPNFARVEKAAARYRLWADTLIEYMVAKGRLSAEAAELIRASNQQYVALHRVIEGMDASLFKRGSTRPTIGSVSSPIARFKGSTREIENPYNTLMEQTWAIVREADRNEALRSFTELLVVKREMYDGDQVDLASIGMRVQPGEPNAIAVFTKGKAQHWQFEEGVHKAIKAFGEADQPNMIERVMQVFPRMLRNSIVHTPAFVVRNVIRDTFERKVKSRTGNTFKDLLSRTSPEMLEAFKISGGDQAGHYYESRPGYHRAMSDAMNQLRQDKNTILMIPGKLGRGFLDLGQKSELVGRLSEFKSAYRFARRRLGYDEHNAYLYAAAQARDLIDYARAGSLGRWVNRYIPFTNAAIQGTARLYRGVQENPKAFTARWLINVVLPTVAVYLLNAANDNLEELRAQPWYIRDLFWNIKVGPDFWLRIPKPFELGMLASGVERTIDHANGNPNAYEGYGRSFVRSLLPVDEAALAGPFRSVIEAQVNYDMFRDKPIVPVFENDLNLDLRKYNKSASRLALALQDLLQVDARKIDHFMRAQFGEVGNTVGTLSDIGREDETITSSHMANIVTGLATRSPGYNAPDVQFVMREAKGAAVDNPLKALMDAYFDAPDAKARDEAAKALRVQAGLLRALLEAAYEMEPGNRSESARMILGKPKKAKSPLESEINKFLGTGQAMGITIPK